MRLVKRLSIYYKYVNKKYEIKITLHVGFIMIFCVYLLRIKA